MHKLTIQVCTTASDSLACLYPDLFLRPVRHPQVLISSLIAASFQVRQAAGWELQPNLLMAFVIDLFTFCNMLSSKWPQMMPFDVLKILNQNPLSLHGYPLPALTTPIDVLVVLTSLENKLHI